MWKLLGRDEVNDLQRSLLPWYQRVQRPLPWRRNPSLYGTWISEIMLQQTTVQTVIPYWQRFLDQFPDVASLAVASEEEVLASWSGLGYYRRARLLYQAARLIVAERGGRLPQDRDAWLSLPGIGSYTAGAIASIGSGQPVPAVDANARRVLLRWACRSVAAAEVLKPSDLERFGRQLVPREQPGVWNQAIMELGALICTPRHPICAECPVKSRCRAHLAGKAAEIPAAPARKPVTGIVTHLLVVRCRGAVLLYPADAAPVARFKGYGRPLPRRPQGLWHGLLGLPGGPWYADASPDRAAARKRPATGTDLKTWQAWLDGADPSGESRWREAGLVRHAVTTYRLRCRVTEVVLPRRPMALDQARWYRPDREGVVPLTALARKALILIDL